ncbi:MAG: TrkH family potassium uptake protein [Clostridiales bacterium]|nr:TrkH family potassium uptake protein [Clostridiales bacterium]
MNYNSIFFILGWIIKIEGLFMALPFITSVIYGESSGKYFLIVGVSAIIAGHIMTKIFSAENRFYAREGFVSVSLGWIVLGLIGALPLWLSREIPSYIDAVFEIVSGFTTTGASIAPNVEVFSHCVNLWRCFSHWLGGMGVLVFVLAILPMAGGGQNLRLMKAESPGPSVSKLVPKLKTSALYLYAIYMFLTVLVFVLLVLARMPVFDALCTAIGTAGTGGYGIKADSIGGYSSLIQNICTVFMFLFGVNFNFYFFFLMKRVKEAFSIEEVKWYFIVYTAASVLIAINLTFATENGFFYNLHHSFFQCASVMTTTGFSTLDFDLWPQFSKMIMLGLMFIGACAGSTGGGMKVSRFIIYFRTAKKELSCLIHPRSVKIVKMDGKKIEHEVVRSANIFLICYVLIFAASLLVLSLENYDFTTNFSAVAATFNNIGPGFNLVGPTQNFGFFNPLSKIALIFDMLAGRLEIFPMLILFSPATWRK